MSKLSTRQQQILDYIKDEVRQKGYLLLFGKLVKQSAWHQAQPCTDTSPD